MIRYLLFDLDGTLIDSKEGILHALRYALTEMGVPVPEESVLLKFIGPPLQASFRDFCGFEEDQIQTGIRLFRQYYSRKGINENVPAPGLPALCARLKEKGFVLALASSKPETMCTIICQRFGYTPSFRVITGSAPGNDQGKEGVIREALRRLDVTDVSQVLMIGDRKFDVEGAKAFGMDCVGVDFFGYAEAGELEQAGACAVVSTAEELEAFLASV